jgi:hypothetical protein
MASVMDWTLLEVEEIWIRAVRRCIEEYIKSDIYIYIEREREEVGFLFRSSYMCIFSIDAY